MTRMFMAFIVVLLPGVHVAHGMSGGGPPCAERKCIDRLVTELMVEGDIPGISMVIVRDGKATFMNYGFADVSLGSQVDSRTGFQLASCSKAFTALAILKLAAEGNIELDAKVSKYIPGLTFQYEDEPVDITIRQLLHHSGGIPWSTLSLIRRGDSPDALETTIARLQNLELVEEPGKYFEYATINYDILALVVQRVTGRRFEEYLQTDIIDALGLTSTTVGRPIAAAHTAAGYKIGFFAARKYDAPVFAANNAAGYVYSNAIDMARWMKIQLGLIETPLSHLIQQSHSRDETIPLHGTSSYAMGWDVSLDGNNEIGHTGLNPNFTSIMLFRKTKGTAVVVLANSNSTYTNVIGERLMKIISGEELKDEFDPGDRGDKVFSFLLVFVGIYLLVVFAYCGKVIVDIRNGNRKLVADLGFVFVKTVKLLLIVSPFMLGLYLLTHVLAGLDWDTALVWTPSSFVVAIFLVVIAVATSVLVYPLSLIMPYCGKKIQLAPQIIVVSILSGLSNVVAVIMVTSAVGIDRDIGYHVFYYCLAIVLYLVGRRYVQMRMIRFALNLIYDIRMRLVESIFSTSYQSFEKIDRGRIYTALNDDVDTIGNSANIFVMLITCVITTAGAFLFLGLIASTAALTTIGLIITIGVIYYFVGRSTQKYFEQARNAADVFMRLVNSMIDGFKEISLHRSEKLAFKEDVAASTAKFRDMTSIADSTYVNAFLVGESLLVVLLGVVAYGIPQMFDNINPGTVMSFVIVLLYLIAPVNGILNSVPSLMRLRVAWKRINDFIAGIPANLDMAAPIPSTNSGVSVLQANGLMFQYRNDVDKCLFQVGPLDFEVKSGQIMFIIGGNGSGKSTLAKLLTGLYKAYAGEVLIDGKAVENKELGEYFSCVFSPPYLFEKIYNVDMKEKKNAADEYLKILDLHKVVKLIDNRYSSINLSNGQRKRLALLQCYLENSPIYLFDEWAADQDPEYRRFFYRTLLPGMRAEGKIVIAITHDDHYFDVADIVVKMKEGQLEYITSDVQTHVQQALVFDQQSRIA